MQPKPPLQHEFTPEQLLAQLRELAECPRIEAKRGSEIGPSVMQTICAFANEPGLGGGYLLLGVDEPNELNSFSVCGVSDPDRLLGNLQVNCREQFEQPVSVYGEVALLENQRVIIVYVPELASTSKPCVFKGKFDSKNKKKTGVWRRGLNGDYECSLRELEPLLLATTGQSFEQIILDDAEWDDLAPDAIKLYRQFRARVKPHAEELLASDMELLRALNLGKVQKTGAFKPNIAGLLLLGKTLSLRRLLPAVRVDYVRVAGTQWVEDPNHRFLTTLDFREPLIRLIPKLEAAILDDLPRHFRIQNGQTQRSDTPLLPYQVVREAVVNAIMHRDYSVHQPTLIVRFNNRLEIRNAGYSLKPQEQLGETGSVLRNPVLASLLYDLDFAEAKGTGIKTMRRLLSAANLTVPVFISDILSNQFTATYLLHQLMGQEQIEWLKQFQELNLSDTEAKILVLAKELGAVDNATLRSVTGLDTLASSQVLSRLCHKRKLFVRCGAGPTTYYQLEVANSSDLNPNASDFDSNGSDLGPNGSDLPLDLRLYIKELTPKARNNKLWLIVLWLCSLKAHKAETLARVLKRNEASIKNKHLTKLREQGFLAYLYPEVLNHPEQAYYTTEKGLIWLKENK